ERGSRQDALCASVGEGVFRRVIRDPTKTARTSCARPLRAWNLAALQCSARPDGNKEKVPQPGLITSSLPLAFAARPPFFSHLLIGALNGTYAGA
ncbi:MAG: hypothetical protein RIE14_02030, partial [Salinisphaeraceae bacterium]